MKDEFVVLKTGRNELTKVLIDDILFLKAEGNYTEIKIKTGEKITISRNLKNTLEDLDFELFVKISRSVSVNPHFVSLIRTGKNAIVKLDDNEVFQPSKSHQNDLKQIFFHTPNGSFHTVKEGVSHIYSGHSHNKPDSGKKYQK